MELTYLYHSGFAIETPQCILVIDYWRDPAEVMPALLEKGKPIYVLSSHFHPDHFSSEVLGWKPIYPHVTYILSTDILRRRRAPKEVATWLKKGETYKDQLVEITAFGSTDCGISFYIQTPEGTIFHAGDLNNWHWQDESTPEEATRAEKKWMNELHQITPMVHSLDLLLFPVDARMGSGYERGARQFLEAIPTRYMAPMHYTAHGFSTTLIFRPIAEALGCQFIALGDRCGASFSLPPSKR